MDVIFAGGEDASTRLFVSPSSSRTLKLHCTFQSLDSAQMADGNTNQALMRVERYSKLSKKTGRWDKLLRTSKDSIKADILSVVDEDIDNFDLLTDEMKQLVSSEWLIEKEDSSQEEPAPAAPKESKKDDPIANRTRGRTESGDGIKKTAESAVSEKKKKTTAESAVSEKKKTTTAGSAVSEKKKTTTARDIKEEPAKAKTESYILVGRGSKVTTTHPSMNITNKKYLVKINAQIRAPGAAPRKEMPETVTDSIIEPGFKNKDGSNHMIRIYPGVFVSALMRKAAAASLPSADKIEVPSYTPCTPCLDRWNDEKKEAKDPAGHTQCTGPLRDTPHTAFACWPCREKNPVNGCSHLKAYKKAYEKVCDGSKDPEMTSQASHKRGNKSSNSKEEPPRKKRRVVDSDDDDSDDEDREEQENESAKGGSTVEISDGREESEAADTEKANFGEMLHELEKMKKEVEKLGNKHKKVDFDGVQDRIRIISRLMKENQEKM
ncbi:hypothetical protein CALVIDRAFT_530537 [Calocera viscosa TUFC12733]|uniref:Uncharacterized protein n=1 Tax=Calocera viscosa (strain TUFC12733) TaxID=1330018 RepID=A0A167HP50_CALVF|nr:hypothetical protein CALVIDRAFT_530537 [Calocera viscosa TUFC12733]